MSALGSDELAQVVAGLQEVEARMKGAAVAEATRGDALFEVLVSALAWCRADANAHPGVRGYAKRMAQLESAVLKWSRKEEVSS